MREAHSIGIKSLWKVPMVETNRKKTRVTKSKKITVLQKDEELGRNFSMPGRPVHAKDPKGLDMYLKDNRNLLKNCKQT